MQLADLNASPTFRLFAVLVLTAALAIPIALVWIVVELRSDYEQAVSMDISQAWGDEQVFIGPFLRLRALEPTSDVVDASQSDSQLESYFFTPRQLTIASSSEHEIRQKGIFKKPVYVATIELAGSFSPDLAEFAERRNIDIANIESCSIQVALSYSQAIRTLDAQFNEREIEFQPSPQHLGWDGEPVHAMLNKSECVGGDFQLKLVARGSNRQSIALVGDETNLSMSASWPHPKFEGRQLPDNHEIESVGFTSEWTSNALARGFASELDEVEWRTVTKESVVGFSLHEPVTLYRMVTRAVKYGFLVVGLTLLSVFCLELITGVKIHAVQYAIVGAALALFYLLLLSFSEHIGFVTSYVVASSVLAVLIVTYAWFSTRRVKFVASLATLLIGIYAALYLCLASTDYALLIGSLLLVVLLSGLMYATRNMVSEAREDDPS